MVATAAGDRRHLIAPFFGRVLRDLVEELVSGWVVAVHDHYLEDPDFPRQTGTLQTRVAVPSLPAPDALGRILAVRAFVALDESGLPAPPLQAIFRPGVLDALYDSYRRSGGNVRIPVQLAHTALEAACDDAADIVTTTHVQVALTKFLPSR